MKVTGPATFPSGADRSGTGAPGSGRPDIWVPLLGCAGLGLLVFLMLPAGVTVVNDDFGYLGSILETARRGRPWTDDWLEPWAASLSVLGALVYRGTGSFLLATQGLQALFAVSCAVAAYLLFGAWGLSRPRSMFLAGLLFTVPTVLWKQVEFTAVALYFPCLLWAAWAALKGRWGVFFAAWFLAFSSRQSAVMWLALPAWHCFQAWRSGEQTARAWRAPALVLAGALPAGLLLWWGMNRSHAQVMLTAISWARIELPYTLRNVAFGTVAWLVAAGLGGLLQGTWARGRMLAPAGTGRTLAVLSGVALAAALGDRYFPIYFEHADYEGGLGRLYVCILLATGAAGWLLTPGRINRGFVAAGLCALVPLALRTNTWDYYYLDVALFGLASVSVPVTAEAAPAARSYRLTGWAVLGIVAACHLQFVWTLKCRMDREYAVNRLTELALRDGRLAVADIGHANYGFAGWQLHPHYIAHEGRGSVDTGAFTRYLRRGATTVHFSPRRFWSDSQTLVRVRDLDENRLVASGIFRVGWIWHQRVSIMRSVPADTGPADIPQPRPEIRRRALPLDDSEWRAAGS